MSDTKKPLGAVGEKKHRVRVISDSWHLSFNFVPSAEPKHGACKTSNASTAISRTVKKNYQIRLIQKNETHFYLLNIHYAKRIPPISFAFGLFDRDELIGVCTYGMPASPSLCKGIAGDEWKNNVLELNRLALRHNEKNQASILVSKSLQMLPKPTIIVSYADTNQNHLGIVYQATNWIYTGATKARDEITIEGLENLHSKAISNMGTWDELQKIYGKRLTHRKRTVKHRYIYIVANKKQRKSIKNILRYAIQPYPKKI